MPVKRGQDSHGPYYQWGSQKRYYYIARDPTSRTKAKQLAERQGRAIELIIAAKGSVG